MKPKPTRAALKLMHDAALAFAEIEDAGMKVDTELLDSRIKEAESQMAKMEKELKKDDVWKQWEKRYKDKANLHSNPQLAEVLFKIVGCKVTSTTPTGQPSTDEKSLLATGLSFCEKFLALKKMEKITSTYLYGISKHISPDGKLRPSYLLHTAVSYRTACRAPNAQNFPKRNKKLAKLVRECFIPSKGCRLIEGDFSILEVRTMACANKDPVLIKYILDPSTDMHRDTAAELFLLPIEFLKEHSIWAKETVRNWAKNRFVFPQFYGDVWFSCAPLLWEVVPDAKMPDGSLLIDHLKSKGITSPCKCKISENRSAKGKSKPLHEDPKPGTFCYHVRQVENSFWYDRFKVYTEWKKKWYANYLEKGYVRSATGFVYEWGGDDDASGGVRLPSKNDVLNHFNQGIASQCGVQVIIWMINWLKKSKMKTKVIGFIHDAILFDSPEHEVQDVIEHANCLMTKKLEEHWDWLIVPLAVEFEVSEIDGTWWDCCTWKPDEDRRWGLRK